jgi:hypothetical protein
MYWEIHSGFIFNDSRLRSDKLCRGIVEIEIVVAYCTTKGVSISPAGPNALMLHAAYDTHKVFCSPSGPK